MPVATSESSLLEFLVRPSNYSGSNEVNRVLSTDHAETLEGHPWEKRNNLGATQLVRARAFNMFNLMKRSTRVFRKPCDSHDSQNYM